MSKLKYEIKPNITMAGDTVYSISISGDKKKLEDFLKIFRSTFKKGGNFNVVGKYESIDLTNMERAVAVHCVRILAETFRAAEVEPKKVKARVYAPAPPAKFKLDDIPELPELGQNQNQVPNVRKTIKGPSRKSRT